MNRLRRPVSRPHRSWKSTRLYYPQLEALEHRLVPSADGLPGIVGAAAVDESSLYTLTFDAAGRNIESWSVNWGDGNSEVFAGNASQAQHTYAEGPANFTISATATESSPLAQFQWLTSVGGNGHYYALSLAPTDWRTVENGAVALGGHLASITSAAEQAFILQTFLAAPNDRAIYWIGIHDQQVEGQYKWTTGEAVSYTNWQTPNEPNNFNGVEDFGTINWHYGHLRPTGIPGSWNDAPLNGLNSALNGPEPSRGLMEFNQRLIGPVTTRTLTVQVDNVAPEATVTGSVEGYIGDSLSFTLDAHDVSAADQSAGFTFAVDWDGNGSVDETIHSVGPVSLSHQFDSPGVHQVLVTAMDRNGGVSESAGISVNVINLLPVASLTGPPTGVRGLVWTFEVSATDATPGDTEAGFTYQLDWDGDGVSDESVYGQPGLAVEHVFAATGTFQVGVRAVDRHGGVSEWAQSTATVVAAAVQDGVLVVGGTSGDDRIFARQELRDAVAVWVNGEFLGKFYPTAGVRLHGFGGADVLASSVRNQTSELFGGADDDVLLGGPGRDVFVGGEGADIVLGKTAFDVVVSDSYDLVVQSLSGRERGALHRQAHSPLRGWNWDGSDAGLDFFFASSPGNSNPNHAGGRPR